MEVRDGTSAPVSRPQQSSSPAPAPAAAPSAKANKPAGFATKDSMAAPAARPQVAISGFVPQQELRRGNTGPEVQKLQDALVARGYMTRDQVNTGYGIYGPRTTAAVSALQAKHDLPQTGAYDHATELALNSELAPSSTGQAPQTNLKRGDWGDQVKQVQDALVATGDLTAAQAATGPGMFGPKTEGAIQEVQLRHGIQPTGRYDAQTQAALQQDLDSIKEPSQMVGPTFQKMMGRAPRADEVQALSAGAAAVRDRGGSLADMRQYVTQQVRSSDEYRASHPLGSGTVGSTSDADRYFVTQWGGTKFNSAKGAPYGFNDCGPTSGVMALSALGLTDPPTPDGAEKAIDSVRDAAFGRDTTQSAKMGFGTLAKGLEAYGAQTQMLSGPTLKSLDAAIDRGNPVILGGDPWNAWGRQQLSEGNYLNGRDPGGHFVALLGKTDDGKYIVGDPLVKGGTLAVTGDQILQMAQGGFGAMEVSRR